VKLLEEKIIPYKKKNRFVNKSNIVIEGLKGSYDYYGQINTDQNPDGIGIAIETKNGWIWEGSFNNGKLGHFYQHIDTKEWWIKILRIDADIKDKE